MHLNYIYFLLFPMTFNKKGNLQCSKYTRVHPPTHFIIVLLPIIYSCSVFVIFSLKVPRNGCQQNRNRIKVKKKNNDEPF